MFHHVSKTSIDQQIIPQVQDKEFSLTVTDCKIIQLSGFGIFTMQKLATHLPFLYKIIGYRDTIGIRDIDFVKSISSAGLLPL